MEDVDGRQWANRNDLITHTGYSRTALADLWRDRQDNGHPQLRRIGGVMHWDLEEWDDWFRRRPEQPRDTSGVDRSGDPDEALPPSAQARVLGVAPSRITQYDRKPPAGWPDPVRVEELPKSVRRYRTRRQLWQFADTHPGFGSTGGRPPGPTPQKPDPRLRTAADFLAAHPDMPPGQAAAELVRVHGQSLHTWKRIITAARKETPGD